MIYFIQPGEIEKVKIGYSRGDVKARMRTLQTGSCEILKLLGVIPNGTVELERRLHEKFKAHHLHLEWFALAPEIKALIERKTKFPAYDFRGWWIGFFDSEEEAQEASQEVARKVFGAETA